MKIQKVIEKEWITQGSMVRKFEESFANYTKARHVARRHVEKYFSWQKAASEFERFLNA